MRVYEASITYNLIREGNPDKLEGPAKVVEYLADAFEGDPTVEWFYVILLDRKNAPMGRLPVTKGTATSSLVHPREVFKPAVAGGACGIIAAHNHPSGDPAPSQADIQITRRLREAGEVLGIPLVDHVVVGYPSADPCGTGFYSFNEGGLL